MFKGSPDAPKTENNNQPELDSWWCSCSTDSDTLLRSLFYIPRQAQL